MELERGLLLDKVVHELLVDGPLHKKVEYILFWEASTKLGVDGGMDREQLRKGEYILWRAGCNELLLCWGLGEVELCILHWGVTLASYVQAALVPSTWLREV